MPLRGIDSFHIKINIKNSLKPCYILVHVSRIIVV